MVTGVSSVRCGHRKEPNFLVFRKVHTMLASKYPSIHHLHKLLKPAIHKCSQKSAPPLNSRHQESDMRQFPHWGPTNIMRYHAKFGHPGQPGAHDLCTPLVYRCVIFINQLPTFFVFRKVHTMTVSE
jgi:hypothetical protein